MSATALSAGTLASSRSSPGRAVLAGTVGHILEWYDFAVYGYLASALAANFFPSTDETTSLLASFATFGVGFVARPFGGFFFGRFGDREGRRAVLLWTMLLMAAATVVIAILPTYGKWGILAPILLVLARLVQGFSAGGETTAAAAFIVEWAPEKRRGYYGSFMQVGSAIGLLLGAVAAAILTTVLAPAEVREWGWRIPFLIGGILAPIGFAIRRSVDETPVFERARSTIRDAAVETSRVRLIVRAFFFCMFWSVAFYFFLSYMPTFAQRELKIPANVTFWINTASTTFYICMIPLFGALSDRVGRRPVLIGSCLGFAILLLPVFSFLTSNATVPAFIGTVMLFAIVLAMYTGPAAAALSEIFPTGQRSSGMAIGYSISTVVFGGFTPFIATWLIQAFGTPIAPIYYVEACAILGAVALLRFKETARAPLA